MTTRSEINALIARVLSLPDVAKFEVFNALREDLAGSLSEESEKNRLINNRKEALAVMKRVAEHLDLPATKVPTAKQFESAVSDLGEEGEEWSSARVIRLWERWSLATAAYQGVRRTNSAASREQRGKLKGHRKAGDTQERYLRGLVEWLATNPKKETRASYDAFATHHNANLNPGDRPVVRSDTIRRGLPVSWANAIAVARGELTMSKAVEVELAEEPPPRHEHALVGLAAIARLLDKGHSSISTLAREDKNFPTPVAHIRGNGAWLYEDAKLYKRGYAAPKRKEGELQHLFIDAEDLATRLQVNARTLQRIISTKRWDRAPQPSGSIATGYYYWNRDKVEAWFKASATELSR